jgi:tape measure domain-containing protein
MSFQIGNLDLGVAFKADLGELQSKLGQAGGAVEGFGKKASGAMREVSKEADHTDESMQRLANGIKGAFIGSSVAVGLIALKNQIMGVTGALVEAQVQLDRLSNGFKFGAGGSEAGAKELAFVRIEANRLGLEINGTAQQYMKLVAASRGSAIAGAQTRDVFRAIAEASTVMGLGVEQSERAFMAVGQMMSKGKVQAEELRGQLGEHLPGAFGIAARAMGMTEAELNKFMETGNLMAEDFLPKFAMQLRQELADSVEEASKSMQASLNRMSTAWTNFKQQLVQSGIGQAIQKDLNAFAGQINVLGDTIEASRLRGNGMWQTLGNTAAAATAIAAIESFEWAVNTTNKTLYLATGGLVDFNRNVQYTPDSLRPTAIALDNTLTKLRDAGTEYERLREQIKREPDNIYLKSELFNLGRYIARLREARSEYEALITRPTAGAGRGMINPPTVGEIAEQNERRLREQQAAFKAFGDKYASPQEKMLQEIAAQKKALGDLYTPAIEAKIRAHYIKPVAAASVATSGMLARIEAAQQYLDRLRTYGAEADKLTEGEKEAIKIRQELAAGLTGTARVLRLVALADAERLVGVEKSIKVEQDRIKIESASTTSLLAKIEASEQYLDRLKVYGAEADKLTEGEKEAIKIRQRLTADLSAQARLMLVLALADAERLAVAEKGIRTEQDRIKASEEANKAAARAQEEAAKAYTASYEQALKRTESLREQVLEQERLNAAMGLSKEAVAQLEVARLRAEAADLNHLSILEDEIDLSGKWGDAYRSQAQALEQLARAKEFGAGKQAGIDSATLAMDEFKKLTEGVDSARLDGLFNGAISGADKFITALQLVAELQQRTADAYAANLAQNAQDAIKFGKVQQDIANKSALASMAAYGTMTGALKGYAKEGSRTYKSLEAAERVFHAFELAMTLSAMAKKSGLLAVFTTTKVASDQVMAASAVSAAGTETAAALAKGSANAVAGVANQANGDPYTAFPRMAAMAAIMAALGFVVAGAGGRTPQSAPTNSGTGTVLGDATAASESLANSLDLLNNTQDTALTYSREMARSLRTIENNIAGFASMLLRTGGMERLNASVNTGTFDTSLSSFLKTGSWMVGPFKGLLEGLTTKLFGKSVSISGSGIYAGPQSLADIGAQGFQGGYYTDVLTKKKFLGMTTSSKISTRTSDMDAALENQFAQIFGGVGSSIELAAEALRSDMQAVTARIRAAVVNIGRVDLQGLSGTQIAEKLNNIVSAESDRIAQSVMPGLVAMQKVGEGYYQTLVRSAQQTELARLTFRRLGQAIALTGTEGALSANALIEAFGGLQNYTDRTQAYFEKFYSEAERQAVQASEFQAAMVALGLETPRTRAEFRALVDAQAAMGSSAYSTYAALLELSGGFDELAAASEQLAKDTAEKLVAAFTGQRGLMPALDGVALASLALRAETGALTTGLGGLSAQQLLAQASTGTLAAGLSDTQVRTLALATGLTEAQVRAGALTTGLGGLSAQQLLAQASTGTLAAGLSDTQVRTLALATGLTEAQVRAGALASGSASMAAQLAEAAVQALGFTGNISAINRLLGDAGSGTLIFGERLVTATSALNPAQAAVAALQGQIFNLQAAASATVVNMSGLSAALANVDTATFVATVTGVFELIGERVKTVLGNIANERTALRDAAIGIIAAPSMSAEQIRAQIVASAVGLPSNAGLMNAQTAASNAQEHLFVSQKQAEARIAQATSLLTEREAAAAQLPEFYQQKYAEFVALQQRYNVAANANEGDGMGRTAFAYNKDTNRLKPYAWDYGLPAERAGFNNDLDARNLSNLLFDGNRALERSETLVKAAKDNLTNITEMSAKQVADSTAMQTAALNAAKQAQLDYVAGLQKYSIDASRAVTQLGRLREETVKYYDSQKALASLMTGAAETLRASVAAIRFDQLDPQAQLASLQDRFNTAYSMALSTSGETLAKYGQELNSLLTPLLQAAQAAGLTGVQYSNLLNTSLARAEATAGRLDAFAPQNYQAESLGLLGTIDSTLAAIEAGALTADQMIVKAIEAGKDSTAAGLRAVVAALTGQTVPAFATGGFHAGGLRMVGEFGRELEATGPARLWNASQTAAMLRGPGSGEEGSAALVAEVKALRQEMRTLMEQNVINTGAVARLNKRWDADGVPTRSAEGATA